MSFANFKKEKNLDLENGQGSNENNEITTIVNQISNSLSKFTVNIGDITRAEGQLGTENDTFMSRKSTAQQISLCKEMYIDLRRSANHLDSLLDEKVKSNDNNNNDSKRNTDKTLVTLSLSNDYLKEQIDQVYQNFIVIVRGYHEKLNSATVKQEFTKWEKSRNLKKNNGGISNNDGGNNVVENDQTPLLQSHAQQQILEQNQVSETALQYHSDLIQQRDNAITSISQGVQDINKIFKDLDEMVNQQGEQIDSIENNIINHATNTQLASHELIKADKYQKKKGKWTCIILVALVVFLLIFFALLS